MDEHSPSPKSDSPAAPPEPSGPGDRTAPALPASVLGLLLKVLVLPTLAVCVFVALWVMFRSLTVSPGDVDSWVAQLSGRGNDRWRAAVSLAGALRDPEGAALKNDRALAGRLAGILKSEIAAGRMDEDDVTLRMYLCRALGEFRAGDGLPVLLEAAATQRDQREVDVRRSAIEAIAVLASQVEPHQLASRPQLLPVLEEAGQDRHATVRSAAAFALGVIGGAEAEARLVAMLADGYADVRYNAATGLARHGNPRAVDVLLEMLDPDQTAGIEVEQHQAARDFKRAMILINALRATAQLAAANPKAASGRLVEAVRRLTRSGVDNQVRVKATEVLSMLSPPD